MMQSTRSQIYYWMQPNEAFESFRLVLSAVDIISLRMNDEIENIRRQLNLSESYDSSLRYEVIKMLQGSRLHSEGLENPCKMLENTAIKLTERNTEK